MQKYIFFDLDDCIVESSPLIQSSFDLKTPFKNERLEILEYTLASCKEAYEKNGLEIKRAMECGEKPKLIGNVKVGSNDIMKTSSGNSQIDELEKERIRHERWYKKPLEISKKAYGDAYWNKEMFLEERDHFLEIDNQQYGEYAIVDYNSIYNENHLVPGAVDMISNVIDSNEYAGCFCLSHHNGGREEICKNLFIERITKGRLPFLGLRFHSETYKENVRRPRSSKALYIMHKFNLASLEGFILVDDSTANLNEWIKYGGMAVLYRPISLDEEYEGALESHGDNYPRITKMNKEELDKALKFYENKVYTK